MRVMKIYTNKKSAIHVMTGMAMWVLMLNRKMSRPAKKRNTARCNRAGIPSTARGRGMNISFIPLAKNARFRARSCGGHLFG
jgi:hypothetical protein